VIKKRFAVITNGVIRVLTNPSEEELQAADEAVSIDSVAKFKRIPVHKWDVFKPSPAVEVEVEKQPEIILEEIKEEI